MSKTTNTTPTPPTNTTSQESSMDSRSPRPPRRLSSTNRRAAREDMDAKIASFEQLGGINTHTRMVLDLVDDLVEYEWRSTRVNRLAARAASATRGGAE